MPSLKSVMKPLTTVAVEFGAETVKVVYRPQYLTPKFEAQLKDLNDEEKTTEAFLALFTSLVAGWDLTNDEFGEVIPLTNESLWEVPYEIMGEIITKVQEDGHPNPTTEPNSGDSSLPADGSVPYPSGTP